MMLLLLPVMFALAALAVDVARVATVRAELQTAADAAALYGSSGLPDASTAAARARRALGDNLVAGAAPTLDAVEVGTWDAAGDRVMTGGSGEDDAVRVRLSTRAGLFFAPMIGIAAIDVSADAVAFRAPGDSGFGFVGLDSINLQGTVDLDSYDSRTQGFFSGSGGQGNRGFIGATNGHVNMNNGVKIWGDLHMDDGEKITANNARFRGDGERVSLSAPVELEKTKLPKGAQRMGNYKLKPGHNRLPGGVYHFASFDLPRGATLEFTGPAEMWLTGNANLDGHLITYKDKPANLRMVQHSAAGININKTDGPRGPNVEDNWAVDIYSPKGPVNVNGWVNIYGRLQAKQVTLSQHTDFFVDESLLDAGSGGDRSTLVD